MRPIISAGEPDKLSQEVVEKYGVYAVSLYSTPGKSDAAGLQIRLKELGYYQGKIDAVLGRNSLNSIHAFQKDHDLQVDHLITAALFDEIDIAWKRKRKLESDAAASKAALVETSSKLTALDISPTVSSKNTQPSYSQNNEKAPNGEEISFLQILAGLIVGYFLFGRKKKL